MRIRPEILAVAAALAGLTPASAQRLSGRVLDAESREPVVAVVITLVATNGAQLVSTRANTEGDWRLTAPAPGTYFVSAKRIGYQPWASPPLTVRSHDNLSVDINLHRSAVRLHPVEVTAQALRDYLHRIGFYERQRADFGHFITTEAIERRQAARVTDLLLSVPGVSLVRMTTGSAGPLFVQLRGGAMSQGAMCRPRVFVDGVLFAHGDSRPVRANADPSTEQQVEDVVQSIDRGLSLDDVGHPSTIAAIEVYRSAAQVPVQFGGTSVSTLCGVIVIWTRTGARRTDEQ
jgi:hypothetical protein